MKVTQTRSGFSLVELMIVLAIISVIALISIPNLTKNVAKAKQKNAQVELVGIFTQEESFKAEFNTYHDDLTYIGFVPSGIPLDATSRCPAFAAGTAKAIDRYYSVGFASSTVGPMGSNPVSCGAGPQWVAYYPAVLAGVVPGVVTAGPSVAVTPTANGFVAGAIGYPSGNTAIEDQWTIDANRALSNVKQGI